MAQSAEIDTRKDGRERTARKACLSGDYAKGVELLSDLFLDTKNPTHIFNQARCYEQNNHCAEAIGRFREYLRKSPDMKLSERTEVERHIEECEAVLKSQTPVTPPPPEPVPVVPAAPAPAPAVVPAPAWPASAMPPQSNTPTPTPVAVAAPPSEGYGLLIAGICSGLAGLGSFGAGLYYYDRARYYSAQDITSDNRNAGKHAENMQYIFYGLGGAAVTAGAVMIILGWPSSQPDTTSTTNSTSFAPLLGPGLAGIAAQGVF